MKVQYHPSLKSELKEVRNYYETCSHGLGGEFVEEFEKEVLKIAAMPERWMTVKDDIRRCLMRRFPYVIYFRITDTGIVRITVVKHVRRHPGRGLDRK